MQTLSPRPGSLRRYDLIDRPFPRMKTLPAPTNAARMNRYDARDTPRSELPFWRAEIKGSILAVKKTMVRTRQQIFGLVVIILGRAITDPAHPSSMPRIKGERPSATTTLINDQCVSSKMIPAEANNSPPTIHNNPKRGPKANHRIKTPRPELQNDGLFCAVSMPSTLNRFLQQP